MVDRGHGWDGCIGRASGILLALLLILAGAASVRAGTAPAPELPFLPRAELEQAQRLAERIARARPSARPPELAADRLAAALRQTPETYRLWMELAEASLAARPDDWSARQQFRRDASAAAIAAWQRAGTDAERAASLALLGRTYEAREDWRPAIRAYRAALELADDPAARETYDRLLAAHGFRLTGHEVDAEAASPRICLQFSEPLAHDRPQLADFVRVDDGARLPIEIEPRQICIDGVEHGRRYRVQVRAGLPAAEDETLARTAELEIYVRDRAPVARFPGRAYVLPRGGEATLPAVSVNTGLLEARVYRIGDRALARAVTDGTFRAQLDRWAAERVADRAGELLWEGTVEVQPQLNREVTTAIPVGALVPQLQPGVYALTVAPRNANPAPDHLATQWFVVTDLGLATLAGNDGLHALVRALSSAAPVGQVTLRLLAVNGELLGTATSDAAGYARFAPGLLRGRGGNAPALLTAEGPDGDYAFLDLTQPPFDLSDRGVTGRAPPQPLDVYLVSERGAYRPGETVHLTALVRDPQAAAVPELPLLFIVRRPDGVEHERLLSQDQGLGSHRVRLALGATAMRGTWQVALHSDPKAAPLAELALLVEEFEPERLTFDLSSPVAAIDPAAPPALDLDGRYLYGAPAAGLAVEGETRLVPTDRLASAPGYRFGLAEEDEAPSAIPLAPARTDAAGRARLPLDLPPCQTATRPLMAEIQVRLLESGGRPVERTLTLPVTAPRARLGLRPLFEGAVGEGETARFELLTLGPDGQPRFPSGARWTLSRRLTQFQWHSSDGEWNYEPVVSSQRVAAGVLDPAPEAAPDAPARIEARVDWGAYRLSVTDPAGDALPVEVDFDAGWYVAPRTLDTPDQLRVVLDRPRYRVGETARVRLEPRMPGLALVMVVDDRLIAMRAVAVPAEGTTVELPVTADWGPGAYLMATLYRGMDLAARRMPARALGLTWAGVEPEGRRLQPRLELDPARPVRPRQRLEIPLALDPPPAPGQTVLATVALVDLGILNLTRHPVPAPDDWYFGQRRLGLEIRDLYGQLIDRMQGAPGRVRAGGDGGALRLEGSPPTGPLLAFQSDLLRLDAAGRGRVAFELPDFNGTARAMAMVWSAQGVGHASMDLLVRDPVVAQTALPRFLAPGDHSRLLLELTQVEGPPGTVAVQASADDPGILALDTVRQELPLEPGGRASLTLPLTAVAAGLARLALALRLPDGRELTRSLPLEVRSLAAPTGQTESFTLEPGAERQWTANALARFQPGSGELLVSIGGADGIDLAGLLLALDRYPHGCTEQLASRVLPLLDLDRLALDPGLDPGLPAGADPKPRIREGLAGILANQTADGSFGLWNGAESADDGWLDAYVTDVLTRARARGHRVPDPAFEMALDNLRNRLAYAPEFEQGGEDVAYLLYALARNGRAAIGDLRYYAGTRLATFSTPLARAQLGAALALLGDPEQAAAVFENALALWDESDDGEDWRRDYGSRRRDAAAILALAAESGLPGLDPRTLVRRLGADWSDPAFASTQEQAWLLLAAQALRHGAYRPRLEAGGTIQDGPLYRRLAADALTARPWVAKNLGDRAVTGLATVLGVPRRPPPAGGRGYRLTRTWYDLKGQPVDPARIRQGERLVAVLDVTAETPRQARLIVDDPLPAGIEIDNPHLLRAGEIAGLSWLESPETPAQVEFRATRFVAALDRAADAPPRFQLAYRVRAVSPGRFAQPAATVEDMYRPRFRAWTAAGTVEILEP